jgi:hypothetical protein
LPNSLATADIYQDDGRLYAAAALNDMNRQAALSLPEFLTTQDTSSASLDTRADVVVGHLPQLPDKGNLSIPAGRAYRLMLVALVREGSPVDTLAHEIGHLLGLFHPRTDGGCGAKDSEGRGQGAETGDPGFELPPVEHDFTRGFKAPGTKDLMTWCNGAS